MLAEWREASRDGVHVDAADYLELLCDGARYRRLVRAASWAGQFALVVATILVMVFLIGLILGALA